MPKNLNRFLPLVAAIALLFAIQNWWRVDLLINPIDIDEITKQNVVLYTTSWCPYCRKARSFFQQANIPFTEYDIEKSTYAYKQYQQISGRGVPVIVIGDRVVQGYNPQAIRSALTALTAQK